MKVCASAVAAEPAIKSYTIRVVLANKAAKEWRIGGSPTQALEWAFSSVAKAGTVSIIGVYPPALKSFPTGEAMNKNLTIQTGNCDRRKYLPNSLNSRSLCFAAVKRRSEESFHFKHSDVRVNQRQKA